MTVTAPPQQDLTGQIIHPGVYDIPADLYHADPVPGGSLSVSGAKKLLPPSCPAKFHYERSNPPAPSSAMEFGQVVHSLALGAGSEIVVVDAASWQGKAAREKGDAARAEGKIPLLRAEHEQAKAMATALGQHPIASALLRPEGGAPERSLFWQDPETGVWLRARPDWLPDPRPGRMILPDLKTCRSAEPGQLERAILDFGYHMQAAHYSDGIRALGLADEVAFVFIFVEKTPPYVVNVVEPDSLAMRIGRELNRRAIEIYRECTETGHWPGYSDDVTLIGLPTWAERRYLEDM